MRSVPLLFLFALAACSGANKQLVDELPADAGGGTGNGTPGSGAAGTPSPSAGSAGFDASPPPVSGGGGFDAGPAPADCPIGARHQTTTSGGTESDATPFGAVACGTIDVGKSYWWTFELPRSTTKFGLVFRGNVQLQATLNGATVQVTPGGTLPFDVQQPYDLEVTGASGKAEPYVIVVTAQ